MSTCLSLSSSFSPSSCSLLQIVGAVWQSVKEFLLISKSKLHNVDNNEIQNVAPLIIIQLILVLDTLTRYFLKLWGQNQLWQKLVRMSLPKMTAIVL